LLQSHRDFAELRCNQYAAHPVEMRAALSMVPDLNHLLAGGHSKIAGRLAGAFRNIGRTRIAAREGIEQYAESL
jgi:hypothetical protein